MTTQTTTTAWPKGVIARYLTDAGRALADPTITVDLNVNPNLAGVLGVCQGCLTTFDESNYYGRDLGTGRHWAQEHAEKCRALPKPAA